MIIRYIIRKTMRLFGFKKKKKKRKPFFTFTLKRTRTKKTIRRSVPGDIKK